MLGKTHLMLAMLVLFFLSRFTDFLSSNKVLASFLLLLGAILPDIDHSKSIVGRKFKFLKWFLKHRGLFHSVVGMFLFAFVVQIVFNNNELSLVFIIGYASHLLGDMVTKEGVRLFYPLKKKYKGPLVVGSAFETILFLFLLGVFVYLL